MTYRYVKAPPGYTLKKDLSLKYRVRLVTSLVLIIAGVATFTTVAYPLISYQLTYAPLLQRQNNLLSPSVVAPVQAAENPQFVPEVVNNALDYTDSSSWFVNENKSGIGKPAPVYTLSIEKLGIDRAVVRSDHTDLKQSLIHYSGTASPGDLGNTVIFGHSVLPQFFNPQNYLTIFSTLHRLVPGETLEIQADGATYTYKISEMYETTPDDLTPLAQVYNGRYLTLITCTPPGTYLRRLIIKAYLL